MAPASNNKNGHSTAAARQAVVGSLKKLHEDEEVVYTGCRINCGGGHCVLKVHRKNGMVTAIEPDDHYNPGIGREDQGLQDIDFVKNRLQLRGCPMSLTWHKLMYSPERILYPMKRVEGSKRGEGKFERISWDEALDLLAGKMLEMVEKYGPYSITTPYAPNARFERMFGLWGAGLEGWGWCSMDSARLAMHLMAGVPGWSYGEGSNDMADVLLNARLIILWGTEPTVTHFGPGHQWAYFLRMARERGTPIICIDPRYSVAAEVLADQWIPIKPGTDAALMMAVANVLISEGVHDRAFIEKYVDLDGFEKWQAYVLGTSDGVPKTPEWAEAITAVPAETIRSLARLYGTTKPTWIWKGYGLDRKSRGENTARGAAALHAITGNWGKAGGGVPLHLRMRDKPSVMLPFGDIPRRMVPKMYRSHKWAQAILLKDKVDSGEMSVAEYKAAIGWRSGALPKRKVSRVWAMDKTSAQGDAIEVSEADEQEILPNVKMLLWGTYYGPGTNTLNNNADSTDDQLRAIERLDFVAWAGTIMGPMAKHADLVLPLEEMTLEGRTIQTAGYGGFANFTFLPGVVEAQGEAKNDEWVYSELARRLGIGEQYNRYYQEGDDWDESWERYIQDEYGKLREKLQVQGVPTPEWEHFQKDVLINVEEAYEKPWHGYTDFIEEGKPLKTKSGKIELWSEIVADETQRGKLHFDAHGQLLDNLPNDWRDLAPMPVYQKMYRGMDHEDVKRFPLMLMTCYPRHRNHSTFWNVPWLRGDCYRHAAWINVSDAQARGIREGDLVKVSNDKGTAVIPAYVTSRLLPGVCLIHHGGWYEPDANGVDWGCTPNVFLGDNESPDTPGHVTTLVEIEKYRAAGKG